MRALDTGWRLCVTEAGACAEPAAAAVLTDWIEAAVPGTAACALRAAGRTDAALATQDVWYRGTIEGQGARILRFEGLAGIAEVWLDGVQVLASRSMFLAHEVEVTLAGRHDLWLCFRALEPELEKKGPRARWRPRMIPRQGVRLVRQTLMGRMPGWTPGVEAVGPWRPIVCLTPPPVAVSDLSVRSGYENGKGWLEAEVKAEGPAPVLLCDGRRAALKAGEDGVWRGRMVLDGVQPWWPHTHGGQPLYPVALRVGDAELDLGRTGFRSIAVDRGADGEGFQLVVNGIPVFCRGAGWTSSDPVGLRGDRAHYEPLLALAKAGGMNMLRLSGTGAYEARAFHDLCDELGILVWQDFMFANFDYPAADPAFAAEVAEEAAQLLSNLQLSPSLAVLCGGSEVHQQGAMMGTKAETLGSPLYDEILPAAVRAWRPDLPYVPNSPSGGALPFTVDRGVGHYYGVGAYCRPIEDARRAGVRFASECLAFANLPQPGTWSTPSPLDAAWKAGTPRDMGAGWDFDDVRDHYLGLLYGVDPGRLRYADPALYLDLSRAVSGHVMEQVFAEWRRGASPCAGGLVWTFQDVMPGAGWGVLDVAGAPKPAWYALKRAFAPIHLGLTDEGVNGLAIHLVNDTAQAVEAVVEVVCLRDGATPVVNASCPVALGARAAQTLSAFDLIGRFFDITYAYRFGPPGHDATVVRLRGADGRVLAEDVHYPTGRHTTSPAASVSAELQKDGDGWTLVLMSDRLQPTIHVAVTGYRPDDDWFALTPGVAKPVRLTAMGGEGPPQGEVMVPGGRSVASFG